MRTGDHVWFQVRDHVTHLVVSLRRVRVVEVRHGDRGELVEVSSLDTRNRMTVVPGDLLPLGAVRGLE